MVHLLVRWGFAFLYLTSLACNAYSSEASEISKIKRAQPPLFVSSGSTRFTIIMDTCSQRLLCTAGGEVFQSANNGQTWYSLGSPLPNTPVDAMIHPNGCEMFISWRSLIGEQRFRIARLVADKWKLVDDPSTSWRTFIGTALFEDSLIVVELINDNQDDSLIISWDDGVSWIHYPYKGIARNENIEYYLFSPCKGKLAITHKDTGVLEFSSRTRTISEAPVPNNTITYRYFNNERMIAFLAKEADTSCFALSSDGGDTWTESNTLTDVRSGNVYTGGGDSLIPRWIEVTENGYCTVFFNNCTIAKSTDYGHSWVVKGRINETSLRPAGVQISSAPDGTIVIAPYGHVYRLLASAEHLEHLSHSAPAFTAVVAIDSLHFAGQTTDASYYSSDGGRSWYRSEFLSYTTTFPSGPSFGDSFVERLAHVDDTVYVFSQGTQEVLSNHDGKFRFEYIARIGYSVENFECDEDKYVSEGAYISEFDGLHIVTFMDGMIRTYAQNNTQTIDNLVPVTGDGPRYITKTASHDRYLFADSLFIQRSDQQQWLSTGIGLPTLQGHLTPASNMVEAGQGELVCGFRGHTYVRNDSTLIQPGGIYTSDDDGLTWSAADLPVDYNPYVWHIVKVNEALLFAISSRVSSTVNRGTFSTTETVILRSVTGGNSWKVVYEFHDRQRPANRAGQRLAVNNDRVVYALGLNEVLYSTDLGESWSVFADDFPLNGCLSDITVDESDVVWVATLDGLYRYDLSTEVAGDDRLRYTSVWLYPTPTKGTATIRLNNTDLIDATQCSLVLYDQFGGIRADLTPSLRSARSQARYEFTFDTGSLESGLYVFALKEPNHFVERYKMLVIH